MWGLSLVLVALTAAPPATKTPPAKPPAATEAPIVPALLRPTPAPSVDPFLKDIPGVSSNATSAAMTRVDGVMVVQRSVRSDKPPEELRDFFAERFQKAGLYIAPEQETMQPQLGVQITGLDTENLLSYTAILQPSGQKGTTVVLAVANLGKKASTKEPIGPVYPGAAALTTFNFETVQAMTYTCDGTPAEIKTFYRDTLLGAGFKEGEPNSYQRGNQMFTIAVSPGVSSRDVLVKLETVGPTPPLSQMPKIPETMPTELPKVPNRPKAPTPP
jgi:hypothetical protein